MDRRTKADVSAPELSVAELTEQLRKMKGLSFMTEDDLIDGDFITKSLLISTLLAKFTDIEPQLNNARLYRAKIIPPGRSTVRLSPAQERQFFSVALGSWIKYRDEDRLYEPSYDKESVHGSTAAFISWLQDVYLHYVARIAKSSEIPNVLKRGKEGPTGKRPHTTERRQRPRTSPKGTKVTYSKTTPPPTTRKERITSTTPRRVPEKGGPSKSVTQESVHAQRIAHLARQNALLARDVNALESARVGMADAVADIQKAIAQFEDDPAALAENITRLARAADTFTRTKSTQPPPPPVEVVLPPHPVQRATVERLGDVIDGVAPDLAAFNKRMGGHGDDEEIVATDEDLAMLAGLEGKLEVVRGACGDVVAELG